VHETRNINRRLYLFYLVEFFDQENIGLGTKIMLIQQLEVGILTEVRLGGGHFEIWLPTVVTSEIQLFLFQRQKYYW